MQKPAVEALEAPNSALDVLGSPVSLGELRTPTTSTSLNALRMRLENNFESLDEKSNSEFQKIVNAAEKAMADRALLLDENRLLFEQNNEKTIRSSVKSTVIGNAKVMSYDEIEKARRKRDERDASKARRGKQKVVGELLEASTSCRKPHARMRWKKLRRRSEL